MAMSSPEISLARRPSHRISDTPDMPNISDACFIVRDALMAVTRIVPFSMSGIDCDVRRIHSMSLGLTCTSGTSSAIAASRRYSSIIILISSSRMDREGIFIISLSRTQELVLPTHTVIRALFSRFRKFSMSDRNSAGNRVVRTHNVPPFASCIALMPSAIFAGPLTVAGRLRLRGSDAINGESSPNICLWSACATNIMSPRPCNNRGVRLSIHERRARIARSTLIRSLSFHPSNRAQYWRNDIVRGLSAMSVNPPRLISVPAVKTISGEGMPSPHRPASPLRSRMRQRLFSNSILTCCDIGSSASDNWRSGNTPRAPSSRKPMTASLRPESWCERASVGWRSVCRSFSSSCSVGWANSAIDEVVVPPRPLAGRSTLSLLGECTNVAIVNLAELNWALLELSSLGEGEPSDCNRNAGPEPIAAAPPKCRLAT